MRGEYIGDLLWLGVVVVLRVGSQKDVPNLDQVEWNLVGKYDSVLAGEILKVLYDD